MNVLSTKPGSDGKGFVKLRLDDGSELEAWTPELDKVLALGEKPIPTDWVLKDNKQGTGKVFLPPRQQGQTAYRNTKEAFEKESASRLAWQQVEEERKDRRTAWMTAAERREDDLDIIHLADLGYEWLRSSPAVRGPAAERDVATKGEGERPSGMAATDGSGARAPSAGVGAGTSNLETEPAGDTSSASLGGVGADTKPGEGAPSQPSSGFPIDAVECDHHLRSGNWVKWVKTVADKGDGITVTNEVCPKCGTPKLVAMEGTNADLGPAI
jgi:hypothetical protein